MPSTVRASMAQIITEVRLLIGDPAGASQQFADADIQDRLDDTREDIRYEQLTPAPSIVNLIGPISTANFIWADYFSLYHWWESDVVLQDGHFLVLSPAASDLIVGHWQFALNVFTSGVAPGEYPPIFATGKAYDINLAAAELLEFWAATAARSYDFSSDGQSFKRSQMQAGMLKQAEYYRRKARVRNAQAVRTDLSRATHGERAPVLGSNRTLIGDA